MGLVDRRLKRLEEQMTVTEDEEREQAARELLEALTDEELDWLGEPVDEAERRVPCPHVESLACGCRNEERRRRGFETYPELLAESARRWQILCERRHEILARGPEDYATSRRYRLQKSREEQRALAERNRRMDVPP